MSGHRYTIEVCCEIPASVVEEITRRFGRVTVRHSEGRVALTVDDLDQSALRALTGFLWDSGIEVLSVSRDHVRL
jgi:tRNA threonylcarbamoyladenosine modification (KEOPS) complex  Pcc1 subunit